MYPCRCPDLSSESPLTVFGRYNGEFPEFINVKCIGSDSSSHVVELKLLKAKEIPLDKVKKNTGFTPKLNFDVLESIIFLLCRYLGSNRLISSQLRHGFQKINNSRTRYNVSAQTLRAK